MSERGGRDRGGKAGMDGQRQSEARNPKDGGRDGGGTNI